MDKIRIKGGRPVIGQIKIAGAKNAVLPIMAACLLTDETIELTNIPQLMDVITMCHLLDNFGVEIEKSELNDSHNITAKKIKTFTAPYEIVRKMRASILVLGPILSRFGQASVSIPGGCAIGTRPIDLHIEALKAMGAQIEIQDGYVNASVNGRLKGTRIKFKQI